MDTQEPIDTTLTPPPSPARDFSGQDRMAFNVLASWAAHFVFVIAGFIMPRLIDHHLGEAALGVWDFGWSMIAYMGMAQLGIGASVNPYVARYRASGQIDKANEAVSSVFCVLLIAALIVLLLTAVIGHYVPTLLNARLGAYVHQARWIIYLLGASLALQIALTTFDGVITGCHRWDIHNGVQAGFYALSVAGMIVVLRLGGDLVTLAAVMLAGNALGMLVRVVLAYRVLPGLRVRPTCARWATARTMIGFGGKTFLDTVSRLLLYQTNSIIIVTYMGPAALAFYSRPAALVSHAQAFVSKFAFVLTPTASSLYAVGRQDELRRFLVQTTRIGAYLSLPMVLLLAILGDPILRLWMGPQYAYGLVLAIMAIGHLVPMAQQPLWNILAGLNWHGRAALANLLAAAVAAAAAILVVGWLHGGLPAAALAVVLPLTVVNGLYMPWYACHSLGISTREYLLRSWRGPLLAGIPYSLCLFVSRELFLHRPGLALLTALLSGGTVMAIIYWFVVIPRGLRARILRRFRFLAQPLRPAVTPSAHTRDGVQP